MGWLAKGAVTHPWPIILVWIVAVAISAIAASGLFGQLANRGIEVPGSDSARATQIRGRDIPDNEGTEMFVLMTVRRPTRPLARPGRIPRIVRRALLPQPNLKSVTALSAYARGEDTHRDAAAKVIVVVAFRLATDPAGAEQAVPELRAKLARASTARIHMDLLGWPALSERYSVIARRDLTHAETVAFPATFVVLLVAFLSLIAAALPVVLAGVTVLVTFALLFLIAHGAGLSVFVTNTASVLALGLSIDYSLFIVTRVREELRAGNPLEAAVRHTLATTGRAVVLSGLTLATAMMSLFAVGVGLFSSMAIGATVGALVATLGAVTLLPATICLLGHRLNWLTLRPAARAAHRATLWHVLGRMIVRYPKSAASASVAILLAMALPASSVQLGIHTLTALPKNDIVRKTAERMEKSTSPGAPGPLTIVTRDQPERVARLLQLREETGSIRGPIAGQHDWQAMQTTLNWTPDSETARHVVEGMRARLEAGAPHTFIGGPTAIGLDLTDRIGARTPYVVLITIVTASTMLAFGLRSIVIPLKAVVGTLLSVAATLGVVVRLFPDSEGLPSLEFFVPLCLFVVVFGLSIDYEVFLLSRIAEAVRSGSSNAEGVVIGLVRSGRSMTLAGLTLATVFLAFSTSSLASFRQLGAGVAIAIMLDITLVRCVLVPAGVVLLGRWNWWFPGAAPARALARARAQRRPQR